jgi:hypothetical protein
VSVNHVQCAPVQPNLNIRIVKPSIMINSCKWQKIPVIIVDTHRTPVGHGLIYLSCDPSLCQESGVPVIRNVMHSQTPHWAPARATASAAPKWPAAAAEGGGGGGSPTPAMSSRERDIAPGQQLRPGALTAGHSARQLRRQGTVAMGSALGLAQVGARPATPPGSTAAGSGGGGGEAERWRRWRGRVLVDSLVDILLELKFNWGTPLDFDMHIPIRRALRLH